MAYTDSALDSGLAARITNGKPIALANALEYTAAPDNLRWSDGGTASSTIRTESGYPVTRLYDGFQHSESRISPAYSTAYLILDMGGSATIDLDAVCLFNLDFRATGGGNVTTTISIADDGAFTSNAIDIATDTRSATSGTRHRMAFFELTNGSSAPRKFTGVRYLRISFATTGTNLEPRLGELIVGEARHWKRQSERPYDDKGTAGVRQVFVSDNRISTTYTTGAVGFHDFNYRATLSEDAEVDRLTGFWRDDLNHGNRTFAWCKDASSDAEANLMFCRCENDSLDLPEEDFTTRKVSLAIAEQGPYFLYNPQGA